MSNSKSETLNIVWKNNVETQVAKLNHDEEIKTKNEISAVWRRNRQDITNRNKSTQQVQILMLDIFNLPLL